MKKLQKLITHPYFSYLYVFVIVFCIICLLTLPQGHPLTTYAAIGGLLMFGLHRHRKWLLKHRN